MAPASSSRRRTNAREPSEDQIETERLTQRRNAEEDVDDDDDDVRRPSKSLKREKPTTSKKGKRTAPAEEDENRIDLENFPEQPLGRQDLAKLEGFGKDWAQVRKNIHSPSYTLAKDVAVSVVDTTEADAAEKDIGELDDIMKDLVNIEEEMLAHEKTLDQLYQAVARGDKINDVIDRYYEGAKSNYDDFKAKTTRQKYAKNVNYVEFRSSVYEAQHEEGMPPLTTLIPKELGDESGSDDDDVEMGAATQDYKDPITLQPLVNPLVAPVCGHHFSAESIRQHYGTNKGQIKCPITGCSNRWTVASLKPDKALAKKIEAANKRARRREQEEEDEAELVE